ncbi:DUF2169 family type VI secretion system accessory protein [Myxococcus llanfairpwllgwyngyllgogerychwyrndrobwllllantysiliogogogochensis]|uniref:DUF2169 family type VI secretion system accessory protein n=1 Tax=Myxococcus llanfairpwllgwyngyllgogerychwyrndrobwllllantysiliogogogochensis TaxID=2590453 RepID=UPI001FE7B358|nr:DUF2169 domain-containing protein [Myxococcus llanfairpwllgwyngyllgogerychwyrndrobwllllantysiliogogogochensis]
MRDKQGAHQWIVVVKATFDVSESGKVSQSDEQIAPLLSPEYHGEPGQSSLRYEAEMVSSKSTTDILFAGAAYAPKGLSVHKLGVSLRLGPVYKELVVFGTRVYHASIMGVALSSPARFKVRRMTYEWAYGGTDLGGPDPKKHLMDTRNPVGKGVAAKAGALVDQPGHSIEYPQGNPAKTGPAGFGPIASHWSPRLELAGTYDERWRETRLPLLPLDYDERHVLCAPIDQRPPRHLIGGEPVELVNLCERGSWRFHLPRLDVSFVTAFGSRRVEHRGTLATVTLEPECGRFTMAWQTSLPVLGPDSDYLDVTTIKVRSP